MPPENDRLIDHSYDGIQEYDNPMPAWWVTVFWATIIFAIAYYLVPGIGLGKGRMAEYEADMAAFRAAHPVNTSGGDPATLLATTKNGAEVAKGKAVFAARCAVCHAADGGGVIGPNLTDNAWIHGGTIDSIYATINNGVLVKGMPQWGKILKPEELTDVAAYVWTLYGTTPKAPKAPQGVVVAR
jgi:cytochrome c oxidase cbb3-type subunit 3